MNLFSKIVATIQTRWRQSRCSHGPWIRDWFSTNGRLTCHCKKCWKVQFEGTFAYKMARNENRDEWIERATKGGMTLEDAIQVWEEHVEDNYPADIH